MFALREDIEALEELPRDTLGGLSSDSDSDSTGGWEGQHGRLLERVRLETDGLLPTLQVGEVFISERALSHFRHPPYTVHTMLSRTHDCTVTLCRRITWTVGGLKKRLRWRCG